MENLCAPYTPQALTEPTYPKLDPYTEGTLDVGDGHTLHYAEYGNPQGIPVVALHGGPGYWNTGKAIKNFNPEHYRVIAFDQRGCGKSTPRTKLENNTTQDLVADINTLREHLNIPSWHVYGSSWGTALALCYAIEYPENVKSLILCGIFLGDKQSAHWLQEKGGASNLFPDAFQKYASLFQKEPKSFINAYYEKLTTGTKEEQITAAKTALEWEATISSIGSPTTGEAPSFPALPEEEQAEIDEELLSLSTILHYYGKNNFFLKEDHILKNTDKLKNIPLFMVHGRLDLICPSQSASKLKEQLPHAHLIFCPQGNHGSSAPGMAEALRRVTDHILINHLHKK